MRTLTRYVLMELLWVFMLVLVGLTSIIFVFLMGKEAVDKGIPLGPLVQMTPYLLPQALQFAVPAAMLLAASNVFGRMSSYNEIVAIKSLGISPMVVVWPSIAFAFIVSLVAVLMNDLAVSWGQAGMDRVILESIEQVAYRQLSIHRTFNFNGWMITVEDVDGHRLIEPTIARQGGENADNLKITARWAELNAYPDTSIVRLKIHGILANRAGSFLEDPDTQELEIALNPEGKNTRNRSPSHYALSEISPAVAEQRQKIAQIEQAKTAQAAFAMLTGDFDSISETTWQAQERGLASAETLLHRFYTEPWRRWANGFSCLSFLLIGAPVAIWRKQSEFIASFFVCFLPILVVYYPLMAVSVEQAKDGVIPPPTVWIGNFVLALAGIWMLRRVKRY